MVMFCAEQCSKTLRWKRLQAIRDFLCFRCSNVQPDEVFMDVTPEGADNFQFGAFNIKNKAMKVPCV